MTTRGWWRSPLRGALARTRAGCARAAAITIGCALSTAAAAPEIPAPPAPAPSGGGFPGLPPAATEALAVIGKDSVVGSFCVLLLLTVVALAFVIWKRQGIHEQALEVRDKQHREALKERDEQIAKARDEWETQLSALHEARLSLFREVMTALGSATAVIQLHSQSTAERTASAQNLTDKIGELIATSSTARAEFKAIATELVRQGGVTSDALSRLSYRKGD